jgi:hypothetical protein
LKEFLRVQEDAPHPVGVNGLDGYTVHNGTFNSTKVGKFITKDLRYADGGTAISPSVLQSVDCHKSLIGLFDYTFTP